MPARAWALGGMSVVSPTSSSRLDDRAAAGPTGPHHVSRRRRVACRNSLSDTPRAQLAGTIRNPTLPSGGAARDEGWPLRIRRPGMRVRSTPLSAVLDRRSATNGAIANSGTNSDNGGDARSRRVVRLCARPLRPERVLPAKPARDRPRRGDASGARRHRLASVCHEPARGRVRAAAQRCRSALPGVEGVVGSEALKTPA